MKKLIIIFFINFSAFSQTSKHFYPKGLWFFGAEIGSNTMSSIMPVSKTNFQGGILAEYYFEKNWSVSAKFKYFDTGVYLDKNIGTDYYRSIQFQGTVIHIPVNIKWEFKIFKMLKGNINLAFGLNKEIKSNYYSINENTNYPTIYGSLNSGIGLTYFYNKNDAFYLKTETISGSERGNDGKLLGKTITVVNNQINFGYMHNFKNKKK